VGVDDRQKCLVKARVHGGEKRLAGAHLFADALEDQNVRNRPPCPISRITPAMPGSVSTALK